MGSPYNFESKSRLPVRPLSYENKSLAVAKELIIDYKGGSAYVCDENKNIIDIGAAPNTIKAIIEYLKQHPEMITDNITVIIDGKKISLNTAITNHETEIDDLVENLNALVDAIPIIDSTLKVSGQAADAKAAGDAITNLANNKADKNHGHNAVTDSASGFMTPEYKKKLEGIEEGANNFTYTLPAATTTKLGGVKVDNALSSSSTNPVQNKVINSALSGKAPTKHDHDYLPTAGGTLTGPITVPVIILGTDSYGETLPSKGTEGQLFFKLI